MELLYFFNPDSPAKEQWIRIGQSCEFVEFRKKEKTFVFRENKVIWPVSSTVVSTNVILGKNGSGKTTLLKDLFHFASDAYDMYRTVKNGVFLVRIDKTFHLIYHNTFKYKVIVDGKLVTSIDDVAPELNNFISILTDTTLKYEQPQYYNVNRSIDASSMGLLKADSLDWDNRQTAINFREHLFKEFQRDVDFFASDFLEGFKKSFAINFPSELRVEISLDITHLLRDQTAAFGSEYFKNAEDKENHLAFIKTMENRLMRSRRKEKEDFLEALELSYFLSLLSDFYKESPYESLEHIFEIKNKKGKASNLIDGLLRKKEFKNKHEEVMKSELLLSLVNDLLIYEDGFYMNIKDRDKVADVFGLIHELFPNGSPFNISWRSMSAGEQSILKLFSRVYYSYHQMKRQEVEEESIFTNVLLLVDEPDTSLHPSWERKILKELITFLEKLFGEKKVQLVITTNKPFFLSDLLSQNINLIDTISTNISVKLDTFCARIPSILKQEFFLESDLGVVSQEFLEEIQGKRELNPKVNYPEMISQIGDRQLKIAVAEYYEKNRNR